MQVTSTELKTNLGHYLDLLGKEDIIVTRNGRKIAKLTKTEDDSISELKSLFGILAKANPKLSTASDEDVKNFIIEERLAHHERTD